MKGGCFLDYDNELFFLSVYFYLSCTNTINSRKKNDNRPTLFPFLFIALIFTTRSSSSQMIPDMQIFLLNSLSSYQMSMRGVPGPFNPNYLNEQWTFLHQACFLKSPESVRWLLSLPTIEPNKTETVNADTALHYASAMSSSKIVQILLEDKRVDTSILNKLGWVPAWSAAFSGHIDHLEYFLAIRGAESIHVTDKKPFYSVGPTSLVDAVKTMNFSNKHEMITFLEKISSNPRQAEKEAREKLGIST